MSEEQAVSVTAYFTFPKGSRTQWWAWVLGLVFIIGLSIIGIIIFGIISGLFNLPNMNGTYFLLLASFLPIFFSILIIYKYWHKLPITALLTSAKEFRWSYLIRTMGIIFIFYAVLSFVEYQFFPGEYEGLKIQTDWSAYFKLLMITLLLVPFQSAAEEFLCRGYLNQALIKYLRSPWIVFIITSGGFALLHAWNPEASGQMGPYLASIFLFGMAMCVLLYFEGGIESAIGAHIANNIFVFALLGYEDPSLPHTALFTLGAPIIEWHDFAVDFGMTATLIMLILWANRKWGRKA